MDLQLASGIYRAVEDSRKGQWTIDVCGLNEGKRPRVRADAWLDLMDDVKDWDRARADDDLKMMRRKAYRMCNQPFADVCYAALHKAASDDARRHFADVKPDVLELLRDEELREALL